MVWWLVMVRGARVTLKYQLRDAEEFALAAVQLSLADANGIEVVKVGPDLADLHWGRGRRARPR